MAGRILIVAKLRGIVIALAGLCVVNGTARAAVQVLTESFSATVVNFANREIQVPQFNNSLGTLESITIDLRGAGAFVSGFTHPGAGQRQLSASQDLDLVLEQSDSDPLLSLTPRGNFASANANINGNAGAMGGFGANIQRITLAGQKTLTTAEELMQFTGCGLVDLFVSARSVTGNHLPGPFDFHTGFWVLGGDVKVTYDYLPVIQTACVPEYPTGIAAGFAGLLTACAAWFSPRSNKKAHSRL